MPDTNQKVDEIERNIDLIKLKIEKRKDRITYYQKLINLGLGFSDMRRLEIFSTIKEFEIKQLSKELEWLEIQRSYYEL